MVIKFLVVDDSGVMRDMIISTIYRGSVFNSDNTEMIQASNGFEGIEMYKEHKPKVILSDWDMPEMNGLDMIKKIREFDKKVPIIMITTEGTEDAVNKALAEGLATDYVVKPLKPGLLEEKLLKAFQSLKENE